MNRWTPFEWIAAIRFLKEGRMQTLFILAGVGIGVGVIVFMSGLLSSLQENFIKRVLTSQPHIQIIAPDEVARPLRPALPGVVVTSIIQRFKDIGILRAMGTSQNQIMRIFLLQGALLGFLANCSSTGMKPAPMTMLN